MQSSKACDVPSIYTCLVPVDPSTQEALPTALEVRRAGRTPGTRLQHHGEPMGLGEDQDSASWGLCPLRVRVHPLTWVHLVCFAVLGVSPSPPPPLSFVF